MATSSTKKRPTRETERLVLRPFELSDAPRVELLAGDRDVAAMTLAIPHPYDISMAESWIATHQAAFEKDEEAVFAIVLKSNRELIGAIGLIINRNYELANLGYWVGKPYWGLGYCSEGARGILSYAFSDLQLNRVYANHFSHNPASGRVMQKIGMRHEGCLRQQVKKWGQFVDSEAYGILRSEFL